MSRYKKLFLKMVERKAKQFSREFKRDFSDNELMTFVIGLDTMDFQMLYKIIEIYSKKRVKKVNSLK